MATKPAKPAAAKKDAAPAAVAPAPAPKSKKKLLIVVAAIVVLIVAAGAALLLMKDKNSNAETPKSETAKEPKFIPLEPFTVNLQKEESEQYLQVSITLKVMEPELEDKIKAVLPEIRSKLNLLLSSKRPSELSSIAGKKKLAIEIGTEANGVLGIHNAGEPAAAPAASAVAATPTETAATAVAASAPAGETPATLEPVAEAPAAAVGAEKKGVVDVLFTSFIIQ